MTEQYRPESWNEVVGQPVEQIRATLDDRPNYLFHGPPGTGKTTVAYLIAAELQDALLEYNASDDRGIDTVRESIIPAARQTTLGGQRPVIFLDEMDSMTTEAQQALRRPMEQSPAVFVLACNDVEAVHAAVKSRCHVYEFGELSKAAVKERLRAIADEGVPLGDDRLDSIVSFANGDMRQAIRRYNEVTRGADTAKPDERINQAAANLTD